MEVQTEHEWAKEMEASMKMKIIKIESEPMGKPGDNYVSIMTRATIVYRSEDNDSEEKLVVVVKSPLTNLDDQLQASLHGFYKSEIAMYSKVFKAYADLMKESQDGIDKQWPQCYLITSTRTLLLEDLRESGFELPRELSLLPEDHVLMTLQALGRFHGLSLVALEKGLINKSLLSEFNFFFTERPLGDSFFHTGLQNVADEIKNNWGPEWKEAYIKLLKLKENIMPEIRKLESHPCRVKVINHGDIWTRNIMFSYNGHKAKDIRFVDFQNPHYNSYSFDLCNFLYGCLSVELRLRIITEFIQVYLDSFRNTITSLGVDAQTAPTRQEIIDEISRLELFNLAISFTVIPLNSYVGDLELGLEDFLDIDPQHNTTESKNAIYSNPVAVKILKENISYFQSINIF